LRWTGNRGGAARALRVMVAGTGGRALLARTAGGAPAGAIQPPDGVGMNYGVVGNCQVAALIDEQARMVWACLPRPDGDPVFSALLHKEGGDSERGVFAIDMLDLTRSEQSYLRNSA